MDITNSKLLHESISHFGEQPLTADDVLKLRTEALKQFKIFLPVYLGLIGICIYFIVRGPESIRVVYDLELTEEDRHNFWLVAPYVISFIFLISTYYFLKYYLQIVRPVLMDLKNRKKQLVFYKPEKYDMSMYNRFYISVPIRKSQLVELVPSDFFVIKDADFLCLEIGPNSQYIFRLTDGDKEIKFFRKKA